MRTYTGGRNLAGIWSKAADSGNLTYLDGVANDDYRVLCSMKDWPFLERNRTISTVASTQFTTLPYDCDQVREISLIPVGSTMRYTPREVTSRQEWDDLNLRSYVSDIPERFYVFAGQIGLWPIPASTGNTIYVTQKTRPIDLSVADITSTTVTSITSGATAVVVSGGVTSLMAGMWIRITYVPGTSNTGDGVWYEISGISGTTITLVRAYGGATITGGTAACMIGQVPLLPEAFQDLPWMWAAGTYWQKEADSRAQSYFDQHGMPPQGNAGATGRVRDLIAAYSSESTDMVIDDGNGFNPPKNPNLYVTL